MSGPPKNRLKFKQDNLRNRTTGDGGLSDQQLEKMVASIPYDQVCLLLPIFNLLTSPNSKMAPHSAPFTVLLAHKCSGEPTQDPLSNLD